jgi:hypothetical protein
MIDVIKDHVIIATLMPGATKAMTTAITPRTDRLDSRSRLCTAIIPIEMTTPPSETSDLGRYSLVVAFGFSAHTRMLVTVY